MPIPEHHALSPAYLRIKRAGIHLTDLEARINTFWESTNRTIVVNLKVESGELTFNGFSDDHPPPTIPAVFGVIVGEITYNLRCALDYLVFELALLDSGVEQSRTQFPIEDSEESWDSRWPRLLKGVNVEHRTRIEGYQPYKRDNWLAWLRDVSNQDKHRQWIITPVEVTGPIYWRKGEPGSFDGDARGFVRRTVTTDGREVDVHMYGDLTSYVTLGDGGPPVVEFFQQLKARVAEVLDHFKPDFPAAQNPPPAV
jgi:hypothetical protein